MLSNSTFLKAFCSIFFFLFVLSCQKKAIPVERSSVELRGKWQLQLDPEKIGIVQKWFAKDLSDAVNLPGTLDENKKGVANRDSSDGHLSRLYAYTGPAWFRKQIEIPAHWAGKHIELVMERTKATQVWLDTTYLGANRTVFSQQLYDLSKVSPGKHTLTILVDNSSSLVSVDGSHAYSEDTQTNWNGIIGTFALEVSNPVRVIQVFTTPDIHAKNVKLRVAIANPGLALKTGEISLKAEAWNTKKAHNVPGQTFPVTFSSADTTVELTYEIGEGMQLWSEFDPALYKLTVSFTSKGQTYDTHQVNAGMREFKTDGTQFSVNGVKTFLRGKHEACVFPLTGYPPMDTSGWIRVFRIAQSYGINHYRFHSWCPPAAAFQAADVCGIYMQPELPAWWGFKVADPTHLPFLMNEGRRILDSYGNQASFVMFALGNELSQDRKVLEKMIADLKKYDKARRLYAQGSNNRNWEPLLAEEDDYWTTFRIGKQKPNAASDVRGSAAYLDTRNAGKINALYPSTTTTHSEAIAGVPIPVIGHEIGQYQTYPDYKEISKYTGVLRAWNFELYRNRLKAKGMLDQAHDFFQASGQLSVICYREDMEMAIRTPGFGGFQLLDLQDYPGQGTALVGLLDAFMDSKGLIKPEKFRQFSDQVVVLLEMQKYCWSNNETLNGSIKIANYSAAALADKIITWKLVSASDNQTIQSGKLPAASIKQGGLSLIGNIQVKLEGLAKAQKAVILIEVEGTEYQTSYPVWIYPAKKSVEVPKGLTIAHSLSPEVMSKLAKGEKVLLIPDTTAVKGHSVGGQFISEFWNYAMFTSFAKKEGRGFSPGTMGILTNPSHPLFSEFPTEFHTNWQWWAITRNSTPIILDATAASYRPVVQVIDNINRNYKLGLVFEFKVGKGKLLVCAVDLPAIQDKPEGRQFYTSLLKYFNSGQFNPSTDVSVADLKKLFN